MALHVEHDGKMESNITAGEKLQKYFKKNIFVREDLILSLSFIVIFSRLIKKN